MYMDEKGVYHCLLVTGEGRRDGVLVEVEGYGYARYASYVLRNGYTVERGSVAHDGANLRNWVEGLNLN